MREFIQGKKVCYLNKELDIENQIDNATDLKEYLALWKKQY